jgi:ADP-ribose pyrophosphatase YjhB (NUDIX family)
MTDTTPRGVPRWLEWMREIQALAQTGLHYAPDDYHRERYHKLLDIATQIAVEYGGLPREPLQHAILASHGYATPKVDVRGAVFREGKILLVREIADGGWCMPGGWADVGESPRGMVEREVREESGLVVRAQRVIGVYDANREGRPLDVFHAYKIVFLCRDQGGEPGPSNETSEARFFPPGEYPPLSVMRTSARQLRDAFARAQNPDAPAAFD